VEPEPLGGVLADEAVERAGGGTGRLLDEGGARPHPGDDDVEHMEAVDAPGRAARDGDDERSPRSGGERRWRAVDERGPPEELDADRVADGERDLVNHHRDGAPAPEGLAA
jgi:hypothetical protein